MTYLNYLESFKCIGTPCSDNCCIGWDVELDQKTYNKYKHFHDAELKKIVQQAVYKNEDYFDEEIDYAKVALTKTRRCAFLNDKNLCKVQIKYGEKQLSNVCGTFPRYTNRINGHLEHSATPSCPEIAKFLVSQKDGIKVVASQDEWLKSIINFDIDTTLYKGKLSYLNQLVKIRSEAILQIQDRQLPMSSRLLKLAKTTSALTKLKAIEPNPRKKEEIISEILKRLKINKDVTNETFIKLNESYKKGKQMNSGQESYKIKYDMDPVMENYLVNHLFKSVFPYSETEPPFHLYMIMLVKYILIVEQLTYIEQELGSLDDIVVSSYIQSFTKVTDHHKSFLEQVNKYFKANNLYTMETVEILLKP